jgi:hypothetical protein
MKEKRNTRLNIEIDEKLRNDLKIRAAIRNITLKQYILAIIGDQIRREDIYK